MNEEQVQELLDAMARLREERCQTSEMARAFLQEEGVLTASGELTEPYR